MVFPEKGGVKHDRFVNFMGQTGKYNKKAAVQKDGGKIASKTYDYSRVEKCLMVRTI